MAESDTAETMVLRTVFLPQDLDAELKRRAVDGKVTKNEVIRQVLRAFVSDTPRRGVNGGSNGQYKNGSKVATSIAGKKAAAKRK